MTDKKVVSIIHDCLKSKNKWFIDFYCPDEPILQDVCSQAKEYADERLGKLSTNALYSRYQIWRKSEEIIMPMYFSYVFVCDSCGDEKELATDSENAGRCGNCDDGYYRKCGETYDQEWIDQQKYEQGQDREYEYRHRNDR